MEHGHSIYHDLVISASAERVFHAISLPEHLNNWWTLKCTGNPEEGAVYNLYFAPEYDWLGEVTKMVSNASFHIKMTRSSEDWMTTIFGFDLEEEKGGVRLRFSHLGWMACNEEFRNSSFCWALLLNALKNYIEKGVIVPFAERN